MGRNRKSTRGGKHCVGYEANLERMVGEGGGTDGTDNSKCFTKGFLEGTTSEHSPIVEIKISQVEEGKRGGEGVLDKFRSLSPSVTTCGKGK
jgi:hypothetical protein